jgi:hypothetical protein
LAAERLDQDLHRPRLCAAIVDRLTFNGHGNPINRSPIRIGDTMLLSRPNIAIHDGLCTA